MNIGVIHEFKKERTALHESNREECETVMDDYWRRLTAFIASDIPGAIIFMTVSPDCTGEIFSDWSEVFEDVVEMTSSREFVEALPTAAKRFPMEYALYNIGDAIEAAQSALQRVR